MSKQKWLTSLSILALTGCAAPMPVPTECAPPPPLPANVQSQAGQQRPTYSERAKPLLELLETQIETAPR